MPELAPFDARLAAAVHAYAARAQTSVDAVATAERAMRGRRPGRFSWLGIAVPVPVSVLIVLALLVLALAVSLGTGGGRDHLGSVLPASTTWPTPAAPAATPAVSQTPGPATDGQADEVVTGTLALDLTTPYTESRAGDVTRLRDGIMTVTARLSDPRVSGTGTWRVSTDLYSHAGPEWGTYRLENSEGAWDGTCSGSAWDAGAGAAWSCWLTGSGAYAGFSHYFSATWGDPGPGDVRGVIVPGSPPVTAVTAAYTPEETTPPPATPSPVPMPITEGPGDEVVRGEMTLNGMRQMYKVTKVGDVGEYRGGIVAFHDEMNDARVTGTAVFEFSLDEYTAAAPEWGTMTITNVNGLWKGQCSGGAWAKGDGIVWSCWLDGGGAYDGYAYYKQVSMEPGTPAGALVIGVVYPGPPPVP